MTSEFPLISIDLTTFNTGLLKLPIQKQTGPGARRAIRDLDSLSAKVGDARNTFRISLGDKESLLSFAKIDQDWRFIFKLFVSKIKVVFLFIRLHQMA